MGINKSGIKQTIDFSWESEELEIGYHVKYHITDDYGPTISVSDDGEDWYPFPAKMFQEVVDFLRDQICSQ